MNNEDVTISAVEEMDIVELYVGMRWSARMIAAKYEVHHNVIIKLLKDKGIPTRSKTESAGDTWKNHKHPHLGRKGKLSHIYGKKLSPEVAEQKRNKLKRGSESKLWGGDKKVGPGGYVMQYMHNSPDSGYKGFQFEHRLVAENMIGRKLESGEVVHHINGNKLDNRPENLCVLSRADHMNIHRGGVRT